MIIRPKMTLDLSLYDPNNDIPTTQTPQHQLISQNSTKPNTPLSDLLQSKSHYSTLTSLISFTNTLYLTLLTYLIAYITI